MSDTPNTGAKAVGVIGFYSCATVPADFARQLERERDRARDTVLCLRKQRAIARSFGEQMERERNEARKALQEIASLGTSQDASPQQCAAVLLAMNALEQ